MIITLEEAKKHLNLEVDFVEDDDYLTGLIEVSESLIEKDIHKTLASIILLEGTTPVILKHACKLMIGNFYANREPIIIATQMKELPLSYKYLISKYKSYTIK